MPIATVDNELDDVVIILEEHLRKAELITENSAVYTPAMDALNRTNPSPAQEEDTLKIDASNNDGPSKNDGPSM